MIFSKSRIEFKRGDDDALMVAKSDGTAFAPGDKVFFSLKADDEDLTDIFQVEGTFVDYKDVPNGAALITIDHEHTISLELGKYYYDILIQWADGMYTTVVKPTRFTLVAGGSHV